MVFDDGTMSVGGTKKQQATKIQQELKKSLDRDIKKLKYSYDVSSKEVGTSSQRSSSTQQGLIYNQNGKKLLWNTIIEL